MAAAVEHMMSGFNPEQLAVYQQLRAAIEQPNDACLCFLNGKARRRKTFLMNCLVTSLRAQSAIVLVVGSTALSIIYYNRGRTAHSTFGIPVIEVRHPNLLNLLWLMHTVLEQFKDDLQHKALI